MRRLLPVVLVATVVVTLLATGAVVAGGSPGDDRTDGGVLGPGTVTVELRVEHSRFHPDRISVRPGTEVRFVVVNDDPINHELIVGDDGVHERHENGTEAEHPPRPGEVTVTALTTGETTFAFDEPGTVVYACHLPRHFAYGMAGVVNVVAG